MKITHVDARLLTVPLSQAFLTSFGGWHHVKNVLVWIQTDSGLVGVGEAAPEPTYDGDTQQGTLEKIRDYLAPALIGSNPLDMTGIEKRMEQAVVGSRPAKAALDMALYDLMGRAFGVPVFELLGGLVQDRFTSSRCLSLKSPEEMVSEAQGYIAEGHTSFEVKMSGKAEDDWARIEALRESLPEDTVMIFDPNEKWGVSTAVALGLRIAEKWGPSRNLYFEQPVRRHDLVGMATVRSRIPVQIIADEPVTGPEAVFEIARLGAADMINVKVTKVGGIRRCLRAITIAETAGIRYRIDCMMETKVANTAGAHLAAATHHELADLDVHAYIAEDPSVSIKGGLEMVQGRIVVPRTPGLGISVEM